MKDRPVLYPRPRAGTRTGRVWEVADEITRDSGRRASRREVVERIAAEDGNPATANTQYQHWKTSYEASAGHPPAPQDALRDVEAQTVTVAPDGRLVIPQEMRDAMMLDKDGRVTARVEAGELRVTSRRIAIRRMQRELSEYKSPGESVVDAFLAERRALWGEE